MKLSAIAVICCAQQRQRGGAAFYGAARCRYAVDGVLMSDGGAACALLQRRSEGVPRYASNAAQAARGGAMARCAGAQ